MKKNTILLILSLVTLQAKATIEITSTQCICPGGFGSIEVTAEPDQGMATAGPFTFRWVGPVDPITGDVFQAFDEDLFNLVLPGTYTVIVTNRFGCEVELTTEITLCANTVVTPVQTYCICPGGLGGAEISVTGDDAPYSFLWLAPNGTDVVGENQNNYELDTPGDYTVMVFGQSGCTFPLVVGVPACDFDFSNLEVAVNSSCGAPNAGSIQVQVPVGQSLPPYQFVLTNSATGVVIQVDNNNTGQFNAQTLASGTYCLEVTSLAGGCTAQSCDLVVEDGQLPGLDAVITPAGNINSALGAIDLTLTGGVGPFVYQWSNGATTQDISNLTVGTYTVTISYANGGCSLVQSYTMMSCSGLGQIISENIQAEIIAQTGPGTGGGIVITIPGAENYDLAYTWTWPNDSTTHDQNIINAGSGEYLLFITSPSCNFGNIPFEFDICNFFANIIPVLPISIPGDMAFTCYGVHVDIDPVNPGNQYTWSNGATESQNFLSYGVENCVTITNGGCVAKACAIFEFPTIEMTLQATNSTYDNSNGGVEVQPTGGIPDFSFQWSTAGVDNVGTEANVPNLPPGLYTVTVTDACGNTGTGQVEVQCEFGLNDIAGFVSHIDCNQGILGQIILQLNPSINTPAFLWSNGSITKDIHNLTPGIYQVTVTDAETGCYSSNWLDWFEVDKINNINYVDNYVQYDCFNGTTISTSVLSGGFQPFEYQWSGIPTNPTIATSQTVIAVSPGTYRVTVTDAIGCKGFESTFVGTTQPPFQMTIDLEPELACGTAGQLATASLSAGANGTFIWYRWLNGNWVSGGCWPSNQCNLSPGYWKVEGVANFCLATQYLYAGNPSTLLSLNARVRQPCDPKIADGLIQLNVTGGAPPYTYNWSNGATTSHLSNLGNGTFAVTVTDARGCTKKGNYQILSKPIAISFVDIQKPCFESNGGQIRATFTGGYAPFIIKWSNNRNTLLNSNLTAGNYCVTITDVNGCSSSKCFYLEPSFAQLIDLKELKRPSTTTSNDGKIDIEVISPPGQLQYLWSNSANTQDLLGIPAGTYTVTVTSQACQTTRSFNLPPCSAGGSSPIIVSIASTENNSSTTASDGEIYTNVSGGAGFFYYKWSGPDGFNAYTGNISGLKAGKYCVTVSDGCNTPKSTCAWIGYCKNNVAEVIPGYKCVELGSTVNITIKSRNHSGDLTYSFSPDNFFSPPTPGSPPGAVWSHADNINGPNTVTVTITDEAGCTASSSIEIQVPIQDITDWTYDDFDFADPNDYAAFLHFSHILENTPAYQGHTAQPFIVGCEYQRLCVNQGYVGNPGNTNLACLSTLDYVSYGTCDCSMPYEIHIDCADNVPRGTPFISGFTYGNNAILASTFQSGCTQYCMYISPNENFYVFIFKNPVTPCGDAPPPNTEEECNTETEYEYDFCVVPPQNEEDFCQLVVTCEFDPCDVFYRFRVYLYQTENQGMSVEQAIKIDEFSPGFFDLYANGCLNNNSGGDENCDCEELAELFGTCPQCFTDNPDDELKLLSFNNGTILDSPLKLDAFPNPFKDEINFNIISKSEFAEAELQIYNPQGILMWKKTGLGIQVGENQFSWKLDNGVPPGLYHAVFIDDVGKKITTRVVKM